MEESGARLHMKSVHRLFLNKIDSCQTDPQRKKIQSLLSLIGTVVNTASEANKI